MNFSISSNKKFRLTSTIVIFCPMCPATLKLCSASNVCFHNCRSSGIQIQPFQKRASSLNDMSGLGFPSIARTYFSCHAASLLAALTTASNSHELNLTTGVVLNFAEEIVISLPCNFVNCTVSPSEVTNWSDHRTQ